MALSTELSPNEKAFSFVTIGALFGLACYGLVTFLRLVQRDYVTDEYKEIVRYLRAELRLLTTELEDYKLPFRPSRKPLVKGGLALTVSLINTLIVAALGWLIWLVWLDQYLRLGSPWLGAAIGIGTMLIVQLPLIKKRRQEEEKYKSQEKYRIQEKLKSPAEHFRAGVGAVICKSEGQVLAFERSDFPGAWQLPQGGVKQEESLEEALFREIEEETGLTKGSLTLRLELPVWIGYELPQNARKKKTGRGQVHKWFFVEIVDDKATINLKDSGEFRNWKWTTLSQLADSTVEFRRPVYRQLAAFADSKIWRS